MINRSPILRTSLATLPLALLTDTPIVEFQGWPLLMYNHVSSTNLLGTNHHIWLGSVVEGARSGAAHVEDVRREARAHC